MRRKIIILGKSSKFIKIIKKIYINYEICVFSWRKLDKLKFKKFKSLKNSNIIFVCGYDYNSQWYAYNNYYKTNISTPLKFINYISGKNTFLFYIDTVSKLKKTNTGNFILSRYEFAKKKLRYELIKEIDKIQIIELPPIIDKKLEVSIFGGRFTKKIFKLLITIKLIKSIKLQTIKKKLLIKNNFNIKHKLLKPQSLMLDIPRPLFIDRLLRIISN
jgi:hypothetical protein